MHKNEWIHSGQTVKITCFYLFIRHSPQSYMFQMFIRVLVFAGTAQYTTIELKYRRSRKRAETLEYS